MSTVLLPVLPGTLPSPYCFTSWQQLLVDLSNNMQVPIDGLAYYNYGSSKPAPEFQGYPWLNTGDGRWYWFSGVWRSPMNRNSYERRLFVGTQADLDTYDGGSAGAVTAISGPAWEIDTDFNGRSPMGVGDVSGSDPAKTLALSEDYGAGSVTLVDANIPSTLHCKARGAEGTDLDPALQRFLADYNSPGSGSGTLPEIQLPVVSAAGAASMDVPFNNVHPVRGCYIVKPTARAWYTVI